MKSILLFTLLLMAGSVAAQQPNQKNLAPPSDTARAEFVEGGDGPGVVVKPETEIYSYVQEMPQFPGGQEALDRFIAGRLVYPPQAIKDSIQGRVYVECIVDTLGNMTPSKVLRTPSAILNEAALKALADSPRWSQAKMNGRPVRMRMVIKVNFVLPVKQ